MAIEIGAVGGYSEVGRNCTAVKVDDDVFLFDLGVHLEHYIKVTEEEEFVPLTVKRLLDAEAIPDFAAFDDWKSKVKAIVISHAHLDHYGAIPFLAKQFPQAAIFGTPFTVELIKTILRDERIQIPNKIIPVNLNSSYRLSDTLTLEYVYVTHSVPQSGIAVLHTPYGAVVYSNDFKFDPYPVIGQKSNYARLQEIGNEGVVSLIIDSLNTELGMRTPSETSARQMLQDVMLGMNFQGRGVIVTTFSSHIARLKSIVEFGKAMGRKVVILGRSMNKYITAAERAHIYSFGKDAKVVSERDRVARELQHIMKEGKDRYVIVMTGHQGEPKSVLSRLVNGEFNFDLTANDAVIFACKVIPAPLNIENRNILEGKLEKRHARIFKDLHASGHGAKEDAREMLSLLKPQHLIPSHCGPERAVHMYNLALEMGWKEDKVHILRNEERVKVK